MDIERLLLANRLFYRILRDRDAGAMDALWAHEDAVSCIHPGWDALRDRQAVMRSWQEILRSPRAPRIECRNEKALMQGGVGWVLCQEAIGEALLAATNIFVERDGDWRMVHHQAGLIAHSLPAASPEDTAPGRRLH